MSMEFLVQTNGSLFEISELVKSVSWEDHLNDGCGKLEFAYLDDSLSIPNGSVVRFRYDNANIFYGFVFKHSHNRKKEVTVTVYDMLRYCKVKDVIVVKGDTVTTLVKKMCGYLGLPTGHLTDTGYRLATSVQDSKTWLDIQYDAIGDTLRYKGQWYSLRDEFGGIALRNLTELETPLILGDQSLCYDYTYEKSIDTDFYNQVKLACGNKTTGKNDIYIVRDGGSISKYGLLQYFDTVEDGTSAAAVKAKANALLALYDGETETLSLNCIGDTSIRAGSSFYGSIADIGLNRRLIVKTATHQFLPTHTMTLEVRL